MKLFSYWRSTAAYRVRIALNLKAVPYEAQAVDLLHQEQRGAAYQQINPQGLVPALQVGDSVLTQSTAIIEYLEAEYPEPPLLPADTLSQAQVRSVCQTIACDIHPLNNLRVLQYLRSELGGNDESVNRWYAHWISAGFAALEQQLMTTRGRFCFGDQLTLADVYLVPQMYNARRFHCDLAPYPTLTGIASELEQHPAFQAAAPDQQPDASV